MNGRMSSDWSFWVLFRFFITKAMMCCAQLCRRSQWTEDWHFIIIHHQPAVWRSAWKDSSLPYMRTLKVADSTVTFSIWKTFHSAVIIPKTENILASLQNTRLMKDSPAMSLCLKTPLNLWHNPSGKHFTSTTKSLWRSLVQQKTSIWSNVDLLYKTNKTDQT